MPSVRVAVVGNLSLDRVDGAPPRPGGPPWYAARALAALTVPALIRVKCRDSDRSRFRELESLGVALDWRPAEATATYAFSYSGDERSMEVVELGERWAPEEVADVHASSIHVGALYRDEFPEETLAALAAGGARVSFDGQGLVRPARVGPLRLEPEPDTSFLRHVTVLKLSEDEAVALVGRLEEPSLSELGVPEVLVTLGSRGSLVVSRRRLVHVPADPVPDCDPTGAGDAFAAAYVVARNQGHAPRRAAERATRVVRRLLEKSR
jgi:sugar/nucleoside kinase (ribokinase family)